MISVTRTIVTHEIEEMRIKTKSSSCSIAHSKHKHFIKNLITIFVHADNVWRHFQFFAAHLGMNVARSISLLFLFCPTPPQPHLALHTFETAPPDASHLISGYDFFRCDGKMSGLFKSTLPRHVFFLDACFCRSHTFSVFEFVFDNEGIREEEKERRGRGEGKRERNYLSGLALTAEFPSST